MQRPALLLPAFFLVTLAACRHDPLTYGCPDIGWMAVAVDVRDQFGRAAAIGATARLDRADGYSASSIGYGDSLRIWVGESVTGVFHLTVTRPYHSSATVERIEVRGDPYCGIPDRPTRANVTISLAPDAPPVRQLVLPRHAYVFGAANVSATLVAHVVADPGVSTAVDWTSRDTSVVRVTNDGVITSACRASAGSTFVLAAAAADPGVRDSVAVHVSGSVCPPAAPSAGG